MQSTYTFPWPDDFHCHFRDGAYLGRTVTDVSQRFARVIAMPNLTPAVTTVEACQAYYQRIMRHVPADCEYFQPLMTLYLTEAMTASTLIDGKKQGVVSAAKLYPAGATTNSSQGVKNIKNIYPLLEAMQAIDLPLLIHGEVVDPDVDIFDREAVFIDQQLQPVQKDFPNLRVVLEHISTQYAVDYVRSSPATLGATITPQHLLLNRNDLLAGGLRPHHYCLPIVKAKQDQQALIQAAISGDPHFFLGTDSAPHAKHQKQSACGCAGIYTSCTAIELYAHIFEMHNALEKLAGFASEFGANFYKLPMNQKTMTLIKKPNRIPEYLSFADETVVPLYAGKTIDWSIASE